MATDIQLYSNNAATTLVTPINGSDLTIVVVDGSRFPTPLAGQYFLVTLEVGSAFEIVKISSRSGNTLTVAAAGRAQESTVAQSWGNGALVEMRATKDTFGRFARYLDRLAELSSIADLTSPISSNGNSYITHSTDDGANPIVALRNNDQTWKFITHKKPVVPSGTATAGTNTTTQLTSTAIGSLLSSVSAGKYILQFTNGSLAGQTRTVTSSSPDIVFWTGAVSEAPTVGVTTFEIYQSDVSLFATGVLPLTGGTMLGHIVLFADATANLNPITKQQWDVQNTSFTTSLGLKAPLLSPTFTGTPLAPTPSAADNTTKIATTAFTQSEITTNAIKNTTGTPLKLTTISVSNPSGGADGDLWFVREA